MSDNSPKDHGNPNFMASIDHFFQSTFKHFPTNFFGQSIPIRLKEETDRFVIEAELPGIKKEQIELEARQQALIIRIQNHDEFTTIDEQSQALSSQSSSYKKERLVPVPFAFREEDIQARYQNGLLRVTITGRRKTIAIK